jgi:hypothetical protein
MHRKILLMFNSGSLQAPGIPYFTLKIEVETHLKNINRILKHYTIS